MKNNLRFLHFWLLALVLIGTFYACSNDPQRKGPQETAEAFLKAMQYGNYEEAKQYCSEGTAKNLDLYETMSSLGANAKAEPFTITKTEEDGDYATVTYDQGAEKDKRLQLHKNEGKWEVMMSKSDFGGTKDKEEEKKPAADSPSDSEENEEAVADKYRSYREGKTAKEVAEAFFKALDHNDYEAAKRYGSKTTNDVLDMQASMAALGDDKKKAKTHTILRVEEDGDYANAYYKEEGEKLEKVLKMGKDSNGLWSVMMTKSDFGDEK